MLPVPADTLVGLYHPWRDAYAEKFPRGVPFKNFLITDPIRQQIPWRKVAIDAVKDGGRPAWNPYSFFGVPLDANVQAAPYYPLNILFLIFDFPMAWTILILFQPFLAGLFLYWYLRHLQVSRPASFVGATAWSFGGFSISWLTWGTIMHTALWLPLVLLSIDSLMRATGRREQVTWYGCMGFAAAMILLGGHIQIALYMLAVGFFYALWRVGLFKNRHIGTGIGITGVIVGLVTAVQWVPLTRLVVESTRVEAMENWKSAGWFLPWQNLVQFIAPDFFGNPATLNYWGIWNYGEFIGYVGIIPLIFALSAVRLKGASRFFVVVGGVSLFFMLPHPISTLPYSLGLPIVSVLQPTRLMAVVGLALAVLSAFGLDRVISGSTKDAKKFLSVAAVLMIGLWLLISFGKLFITDAALIENFGVSRRNLIFPTLLLVGLGVWLGGLHVQKTARTKSMWLFFLIIVIVFDLFRFGWKYTPFTPVSYFFPDTNVISFLKSQPRPFRVMSLDDRILPPNTGAYYGIETIEGYDPIAPSRYEDFLVAFERGKADITRPTGFNRIYTAHNIDSLLLRYTNVRYVLSLSEIVRPYLRLVMREGETRVYEYTRGLPRAYLADTVRMEKSPQLTLSALFDPEQSLVGVIANGADLLSLPLRADEVASISSYTENRVEIQVTAVNPRLLVVLNRYDPRWRVTIDGVSQPVFQANYLFMGVRVSPGTHRVILSYR